MRTRNQSLDKNPNFKHGHYKSAEYRHWVGMKRRCAHDPHYIKYNIRVCPEWENDFVAFYHSLGPKPFPRATLDRIDGNLGYEPNNVRWATYSEQNRNLIKRGGKPKPKTLLAEKLNLHINTLLYRKKNGLAEDAPKYGQHTMCRNGHEYTEQNTYLTPKGIRKCRKCMSMARDRYRGGMNPKRNEM